MMGPNVRRASIVGVMVIAAVLALGAIDVPATAYRDGDFLQFWIQPQAVLEGASPYDPVWWAEIHRRVGGRALFAEAVYPPYDAFAFLPLALMPLSYAAAFWLVAQIVAVAATVVSLARRITDRGRRAVFLAVVVSFQPLWLLVVGGNVTGFLFAALGGAYLAALDRRMLLCGALLGLLAVKPHPFVFLAVAVLVSAERVERRALVLGALTTVGPLLAVTALLRPSWYVEWLPAALSLQSAPGSNATVWTIGRLIGVEAPQLGGIVAILMIGGFGLWAYRTAPPLALAIAAAVPASLAVAPHGWSYDQLQLLVPLSFLFDRIGHAAPRPRAMGLVALAVGAAALPWALYVVAFSRGGEELSALTPLLTLGLMCIATSGRGHRIAASRPSP